MKKNIALLAAGSIIVVLLGVIFIMFPSGIANAPTTSDGAAGIADLISVSAPLKNATISSPLSVTGQARGNWYFEASFPVVLKDAQGAIIAQVPAQAQGEWMTTDFVPFVAALTFPAQTLGSKGTLVLKKDNPSGDPERDQSVEIPVTF
jgi:hypothetical protein